MAHVLLTVALIWLLCGLLGWFCIMCRIDCVHRGLKVWSQVESYWILGVCLIIGPFGLMLLSA